MHHFDLQYDIVRLRHDELVQQTHPGRGTRRDWSDGAAARTARRLDRRPTNAVVSSPCLLPGRGRRARHAGCLKSQR